MKTLKFKTTIKCSGCVGKVSPILSNEDTIKTWEVDIDTPEKILTVETSEENPDKIIELVEKAGFKIEPIQN